MNAPAMACLGVLGGVFAAWTRTSATFLVVPVLALLEDPPDVVAAALAVVLVQGAWGARKGCVAWGSAAILGVAALPGILLAPRLPPEAFRNLSWTVLAGAGLGMLLLRRRGPPAAVLHLNPMDDGPPGARALRRFTDAAGRTTPYRLRLAGGIALAALLGLSCGALGLEGTPLLAGVLLLSGMPAPLAAPTAGAALALPAAVALLSRAGAAPWGGAAWVAAGALAGLALRPRAR